MYSDGVLAEMWFISSCRRLGVLDKNPPTFQILKKVLNKYLNNKVKQVLPFMEDRQDPKEWLDRVLKTDCLLSLEDKNGQLLRVAVDVTANEGEASEKLLEISSPDFARARKELKIDKHWVVIVKALEVSSPDVLIDVLYAQVDAVAEYAILVVG